MVVRDLDGGHIAAVSYDANAPLERTLKSFAVNLTSNPTFSQLLNQARGEKVEVVLQQANATQPGTLTGTVIGCERQKQAVGKDTVEAELLNLWCADGMRSLKLSEVQRVRFLSPVMDSEFRKALETLAQAHDTQKKAVTLTFAGEGKRQVRVGYVVENPIWKTSYRLVCSGQVDHKRRDSNPAGIWVNWNAFPLGHPPSLRATGPPPRFMACCGDHQGPPPGQAHAQSPPRGAASALSVPRRRKRQSACHPG
jgi:hypothetical protein